MKTVARIVLYGLGVMLLLPSLGGQTVGLPLGLTLIGGLLRATDAWGLQTRLLLARYPASERDAVRQRWAHGARCGRRWSWQRQAS